MASEFLGTQLLRWIWNRRCWVRGGIAGHLVLTSNNATRPSRPPGLSFQNYLLSPTPAALEGRGQGFNNKLRLYSKSHCHEEVSGALREETEGHHWKTCCGFTHTLVSWYLLKNLVLLKGPQPPLCLNICPPKWARASREVLVNFHSHRETGNQVIPQILLPTLLFLS